ncbi:MAG: hypothetical protein C0501_07835 [Isosphaera sp.]|nr:hypothetical protein [Isosphaera sp.]
MTKPIALLAALALTTPAPAADLTVAAVADPKGDGPDGKGNTADDTWQFWFELADKPGHFHPLDTHSTAVPKKGVPKKITGPVAALLPNPDDTAGWVFHRDWDGRFEGVWGDAKGKQVIASPYVEKTFHGAVAVTYRVPVDGRYDVSGGLTDLQVAPEVAKHDGVEWLLELADDARPGKKLTSGGPIGDGNGRPDCGTFEAKGVEAKKGQLVRLAIRPRAWWGTDLTRIDAFRVVPAAK